MDTERKGLHHYEVAMVMLYDQGRKRKSRGATKGVLWRSLRTDTCQVWVQCRDVRGVGTREHAKSEKKHFRPGNMKQQIMTEADFLFSPQNSVVALGPFL